MLVHVCGGLCVHSSEQGSPQRHAGVCVGEDVGRCGVCRVCDCVWGRVSCFKLNVEQQQPQASCTALPKLKAVQPHPLSDSGVG